MLAAAKGSSGIVSLQLDAIPQSQPGISGRDSYFLSSCVSGMFRPVCASEGVAVMALALEKSGLNLTAELFMREVHQADAACL